MRSAARIVALVVTLGLAGCGARGASAPRSPSAAQSPPPVATDADFDQANFTHPTEVANPWFPLVPGTRFTWEGHATDEGERVTRKVVFTVTDLTKVVNGVPTVVTYDNDFTSGELEEDELSFFAQDDDGNVWYLGEYPEELDGGKVDKTPTWIAGLHGARAGIHMPAVPRLDTPSYAMGWGGSDVDWTDRGKVDQLGKEICVPLACYADVLVIDEFNPDEPGTHQLKFYAPGRRRRPRRVARGPGGRARGARARRDRTPHLRPDGRAPANRVGPGGARLPAQPRRLRHDGSDRAGVGAS